MLEFRSPDVAFNVLGVVSICFIVVFTVSLVSVACLGGIRQQAEKHRLMQQCLADGTKEYLCVSLIHPHAFRSTP